MRCLLERVEACCREERSERGAKSWVEEENSFRLERRFKKVKRFILCSIRDVKAKRFCLVFPKGREILRGWVKLAEKLHLIGVVTPNEAKKGCGLGRVRADKSGKEQVEVEEERMTFVEVAKTKVGKLEDSVWL